MFVFVAALGDNQRKKKAQQKWLHLFLANYSQFVHLFALGGIWEALFLVPPLLRLGCLSPVDYS